MNCVSCNCGMEVITVNDRPNLGYAYNVYECFMCMILAKEDVWKNAGVLWIFPNGHLTHEPKVKE